MGQAFLKLTGIGNTLPGRFLNPTVAEWPDNKSMQLLKETRSLNITSIPVSKTEPSSSQTALNLKQKTFTEDSAKAWETMGKNIDQIEIDCQIILHEIFSDEKRYLKELEKLLHDLAALLKVSETRWAQLGLCEFNMDHLVSLAHICEHIYRVNQKFLYEPFKLLQMSEGPWLTAILKIFRDWLKQSSGLYIKYVFHHPHGNTFMLQLENCELMKEMSTMYQLWPHYLSIPLRRIESYDLYLERIFKISDRWNTNHELGEIEQSFDRLKCHVESCCLAMIRSPERDGEHPEDFVIPGDTKIVYKKWLKKISYQEMYGEIETSGPDASFVVFIVENPFKSVLILKEIRVSCDSREKKLEIVDDVGISKLFPSIMFFDDGKSREVSISKLHDHYDLWFPDNSSAATFSRKIENIQKEMQLQDQLYISFNIT